MAPATYKGLREPTEEELRAPFVAITGLNLRPRSTEHSNEQKEQEPEPGDR
jgi:hypothetical protein